jgi:hypothetical protein
MPRCHIPLNTWRRSFSNWLFLGYGVLFKESVLDYEEVNDPLIPK